MRPSNFMPPSLGAVISIADGFSDAAYDQIADLVQKPKSTDPKESDLQAVCAATSIDPTDLRYVLSFLSFLYQQTDGTTDEELRTEVSEFLSEYGQLTDPSRLADKLAHLLKFKAVYHAANKLERMTKGFLPFLMDASSFVDMRSDFDRDNDGNLTGKTLGTIPIIQLQLSTDSPKAYERDFIVQLDEAGLETLETTLKDIRAKLGILTKAT